METSSKDDFYLYANYDWLLNTDIPEGSRVVGASLAAEGREHAAKAVSGNDLNGHDARQAQLLYRAAADTAARDAAGVEPAKATVNDIRSLSTVDDVAAFLLDPMRSVGAPSLIGATAQYDGSTNGFHVAAGSVEPDVTRYEAGEISLAELMGGPTGYCVFREIGHALDSIDISVDKDGNVMDGSLLEPDARIALW